MVVASIRSGFEAGWAVRKAAQYAAIVNPEPPKLVERSFFPQMELGNDV